MGEPVFQAQQESKLIPPSLRSDSKAERWIKRISQAPAIWKLTVPVSWSPLGCMNTLHIYVITKMTRCLQKSEWSNNPEGLQFPWQMWQTPVSTARTHLPFPSRTSSVISTSQVTNWRETEQDGTAWCTQTRQTPPHTLSAQREITYSPQNSQGRK